jgi:hypothetical protein
MTITGIRDLDKEVLLKIEKEEDFLMCRRINSYIYSLYDEFLFERRIKRKYPDVKNLFEKRVKKRYPDVNIKSLNYKNLYIKTIKEILKLKIRYNFEFLKGNPEKYLKIFSNPLKYEYRAYLISKYNYKDVFYMLYTQHRDHFLDGAASVGQLELIKEWISNHNFTVSNYDTALCSAIKTNKRNIIDFLLSLGANDYREFLIEAAKYNHQDLVNIFQSLINKL